ncbi:hypothetical protein PQQ51_18955 [Paraburkholderia xenovorans]|uniref:hypothetical protein n=1 Tax=Paraburkholderia xenovorans TaxID=36873 RepID=UPI0038BB8B72
MIEFLSPAVLSAVLRASSSPIFSAWLASASRLTPRSARRRMAEAVSTKPAATEGTHRV